MCQQSLSEKRKLWFKLGRVTALSFSQSGVSVFLSLLVFVTFSGGSGAAIHEKKSDWCFIESVCLLDLSDSIWCFLLHLYLSSYIAPPPTPSLQIWLPVSPFWFSKASEHETATLNIGQIFILWSSLLTSLYLRKPPCFFCLFSHFLIVRVADRHATESYWI